MAELSPESMPFDTALGNVCPVKHAHMRGALVDVSDTIDMAKRMLMQNRVRSFTAADVVNLTRIIIEREQVLRQRGEE